VAISDIAERDMDPATRWRVLHAIAERMGADLEHAAEALWYFENISTSEGQDIN
jgi:hypothetical protein